MDPRSGDTEAAASPRERWGAAIAIALAIALYLGLQARSVGAAVLRGLEALLG